ASRVQTGQAHPDIRQFPRILREQLDSSLTLPRPSFHLFAPVYFASEQQSFYSQPQPSAKGATSLMDKRNIKSKGYDSMDLLEEEDHSADEEMDDKPIPGVELGKKCQKGDIVSKVFSRSRFVITDRQQGMDGRVSYTLRSITYVEGSKDPDRVQPAGDPFQIDDDDSTYHLSPFCVRQGRIEPIDRDDEEVDEEMSAEEPLSGKKGEKEKVQISIPKSGPS